MGVSFKSAQFGRVATPINWYRHLKSETKQFESARLITIEHIQELIIPEKETQTSEYIKRSDVNKNLTIKSFLHC